MNKKELIACLQALDQFDDEIDVIVVIDDHEAYPIGSVALDPQTQMLALNVEYSAGF